MRVRRPPGSRTGEGTVRGKSAAGSSVTASRVDRQPNFDRWHVVDSPGVRK